jgi:hypothetical protein
MIEAPTKEPRDLYGADGVRVEVVSRTFRTRRGEVAALAEVSLYARRGEIVALLTLAERLLLPWPFNREENPPR